jgi:hypothetical protein
MQTAVAETPIVAAQLAIVRRVSLHMGWLIGLSFKMAIAAIPVGLMIGIAALLIDWLTGSIH